MPARQQAAERLTLVSIIKTAQCIRTAQWRPARMRRTLGGQGGEGGLVSRIASVSALLLTQLSPVILLSITYPFAASRLAGIQLGGLPFPRLLLATSLTAPWLSQIVCMPLFAALSPHVAAGRKAHLTARALEAWPLVFAASVPVVVLLAVPVWLRERWSLPAMLVYMTLCLLNAGFAQSLVYSIIKRNGKLWALGWLVYAAALFAVPRLWFLPPLAGMLLQTLYLAWHSRILSLRPVRPERIVAGLGKGMLLGCVLWSDKYFYFLRFPGNFDPALVFGAMLPAIVAYNYYFALLAPRTDGLVDSVRKAMTGAPLTSLREECDTLSEHIRSSTFQAGLVCALLSIAALAGLRVADPAATRAAAAEMLACWCFVMGTLACYKLAYLGQDRLAYGYGALHLALACAIFAAGPSGPAVYLTLAAAEILMVALILRTCLRGWARPEFMLFWRHAIQW
ncbi:MAG: hypothetical protein ACLPUO_23635 [Streptosporangiaceae bacterium]